MSLRLPPIVLFDDGRGRFGPLTDLRATFELRTGALSTAERAPVGTILWPVANQVELVAARWKAPVRAIPEAASELLIVNGRISDFALPSLGELNRGRGAVIEQRSGDVVMARLTRAETVSFLESGSLPASLPLIELEGVRLLARPWEILDPHILGPRLQHDLTTRFADWPTIEGAPGVVRFGTFAAIAHPDARILPGVVIDCEHGSVAIGAGTVVRPGAVLVGPVFVGDHCIVAERTLLKARTVVGPHCRVAGEIGGTIFQGYANKAHDGHLGDSFVGEWVNLGAGTTNSNLLNTYGEVAVRLEPDAPPERTGRQFVGAIIGDHVKTAILSRLPTGCVLGTGSMIASSAFAPALVPRFSWLTDGGPKSYRFDKFLAVARAVWARRGVEASPAMVKALEVLHARSAPAADVALDGRAGAPRGPASV